MGLPYLGFFPAASERHIDSRSVHIPYPSVLSSGIFSLMAERPFSYKYRYRFCTCGFLHASGGRER
ncbi:hypothetical protein [Bacteroides sp. An19]|uniref:hypothetical protein n=1 Tax=Bacteroides sp. An19 TaxID=1965580 RepID=UPI0011229318|nr:hypothetical protein [Bacteroides sp. An19]